jgi:hypothetical protein
MHEREHSTATARTALLFSGALLLVFLLLLISGFSPREGHLSDSGLADAVYAAAEALTASPQSGDGETSEGEELSSAVDAYIREHNEKNRH